MSDLLRTIGATLLLLALATPGTAEQEEFKYPPPELGPEYVAPETAFPPHR